MTADAVTEWLKSSVLGIVLLGAVGSIVAVALLKYLGPPIRKLGLKPVWYFRKEHMWRYWRSSAAYGHIVEDSSNRKLIYYLFRHLARLVLACGLFTVTSVVFAVLVASQSQTLLTYGTFILSMAAILSAYWIRVEYDYVTINYVVEWRKTGLVKNPFANIKDPLDGTEPQEAATSRKR